MNNIQITRSPIDGSIYVERKLATQADIKKVITKANTVQSKWKKTSIAERAGVCNAMVDFLTGNEEEIAEQLCWMMGRPIRYCKSEVAGMAERARYMISAAEAALKTIMLEEKLGFKRYIKREPLGVVVVIAPWNYPYLTAINTIIPAIMAGNTVVLKHSAQTPLCAEQFAKAFEQACQSFSAAQDIFQYLHLSHHETEKLISNPSINYVAFTGSVAGGEMVERAASGRFIGIGLELGGKDPAYVRQDADISSAVTTCIDGAFFNAGQSCCAIERIYVHDSIYDEFVSQAVALVNQYKLGRPDNTETTLGPLVKAANADYVRQQTSSAISAGAKWHIDPDDFQLNQDGSAYLAPQLLTNVDHSMSLMRDESFGPVVGVMKVNNDEEAIALMNDSDLGLSASVFTKDIEQGIKIGEQLDTGTFFINRCDYLDPALAWTGVKKSGRGCTLSTLAYQVLTRPKSFHIKES